MNPKATPESFWVRTMYTGDCIVFTGHLNHDGYGRLRYHGHLIMAHRLAYELTQGKIPDGFEIDHICRNRACVNTGHLQALEGTEHTIKGNKTRYGLLHRHSGPGHDVVRRKDGLPFCKTCGYRKARAKYLVNVANDREGMNRARRESRQAKKLRDGGKVLNLLGRSER